MLLPKFPRAHQYTMNGKQAFTGKKPPVLHHRSTLPSWNSHPAVGGGQSQLHNGRLTMKWQEHLGWQAHGPSAACNNKETDICILGFRLKGRGSLNFVQTQIAADHVDFSVSLASRQVAFDGRNEISSRSTLSVRDDYNMKHPWCTKVKCYRSAFWERRGGIVVAYHLRHGFEPILVCFVPFLLFVFLVLMPFLLCFSFHLYSRRKSRSEPSERLPRSNGKIVRCHTGFVSGPIIQSSGMPSVVTGAVLSWDCNH